MLQAGRPVVFCGRAQHAPHFAVGPSYDAPESSLRPTTLITAQPGELYRTHFFRLVIEYGETSDEARLESYSMYGLPTAAPVVYSAEDLSFDAVAIVLDDYQVDEVVVRRETAADKSPVHHRPVRIGRLADTIPFYWKGEYHIFYLRAVGKVPWEHVVSRDLVHWRECPTALVADGDATSADGLNMFTGSVIEHDGRFHMFYVGWNPNNPDGREFIMHAVSDDLMEWKKLPDDRLGPDGQRYSNVRERDFRDPFVVRDEQADKFWMFLVHGSRHRSCLVARSATLGIRRAAAIELRRFGYTGVSGHLHDRRSHLPDRFADQYQEHYRPSRKGLAESLRRRRGNRD